MWWMGLRPGLRTDHEAQAVPVGARTDTEKSVKDGTVCVCVCVCVCRGWMEKNEL